MKHVHFEKIVAKAANMDLVVFGYCNLDKLWSEEEPSLPGVDFIDSSNTDYFLCLPQHKEACLHWLNGGDVQEKGSNASDSWWSDSDNSKYWSAQWHEDHIFMSDVSVFRIKPKKEKRWIAVNPLTGSVELFGDEKVLDNCLSCPEYKSHQKIEIEVEV